MTILEGESYLSLATYRKSGKEVATPVWFAPENNKLYCFSMANSGKEKRLRNSPRSRVAACDFRGQVHGEWIDTETRVLEEPAAQERARLALRKKYRFQMLMTDIFGTITGRRSRRSYFEITPT